MVADRKDDDLDVLLSDHVSDLDVDDVDDVAVVDVVVVMRETPSGPMHSVNDPLSPRRWESLLGCIVTG